MQVHTSPLLPHYPPFFPPPPLPHSLPHYGYSGSLEYVYSSASTSAMGDSPPGFVVDLTPPPILLCGWTDTCEQWEGGTSTYSIMVCVDGQTHVSNEREVHVLSIMVRQVHRANKWATNKYTLQVISLSNTHVI